MPNFLEQEIERAFDAGPPPDISPPTGEPPEHAFNRELVRCAAPPVSRRQRPTVEEAREWIRDTVTAYLNLQNPEHMLLIRAAPGTGKTTIMVDIAHQIASQRRVMYVAPRHDFFHDVLRAAQFSGHDPDLWYEWLPRQEHNPETCQHAQAVNRWASKGYRAIDFCIGVCGNRYMGECPYLAQKNVKNPLIMTQHPHVTLGHPLDFGVVIGDESPLGAFLNKRYIATEDIIPQAMDWRNPFYPLVSAIAALTKEDRIIEGPELFAPDALNGADGVLELCEEFAVPLNAVLDVDRPHSVAQAEAASVWYLHELSHLLRREATLAAQGREYPHRLLIGRGYLRIMMRHTSSEKLPPHVIWTDATGNKRIYEAMFQRPVLELAAEPKILGDVYQVVDRANGKSTLVDYDDDGNSNPSERAGQMNELIQRMVKEHGYQKPVTISFQDTEKLWATQADHFYGARGTNDYADCDAIFVVGAPMPSVESLVRLAAMIFYERDTPFNTSWRAENKPYDYIDKDGVGRAYPVGGYWGDEDLEAVVSIHREDEILQSAHRVRPILSPKDVWLLTNVPIPGLGPTILLTMRDALDAPEGVSIWNWADMMDALAEHDVITARTIADAIGVTRKTAKKYLDMLRGHGWRSYDPDVDGDVLVRKRGPQPDALVRDK